MPPNDDATQQGVSANEQPANPQDTDQQLTATPEPEAPANEPPERPRSRRELALEAVERSRRESFEQEAGVKLDEPAPQAPEPEPPPEPPTGDDQLQQQLTSDAGRISGDDMKKLVSLKVFGEEKVIPLEEALRIAQKQEAADRRLAEANERFRLAEDMVQQLLSTKPALPDSETPPNNGPSPDPSDLQTVKAKVKGAIEAVFRGDEEASAERLAQVIVDATRASQPTAQPIDPVQIAQIVGAQLEQQSVSKEFLTQYPLFAQQQDPTAEFRSSYMRAMHQQRVNAYLEQGLEYRSAVMQAGDDTYRDFGIQPTPAGASGQGGPSTASRSQELASRKAQLGVPAGRTASAASSSAPVESSEQQRASTIAEMAAARRTANLTTGRPPPRR